MLYYIFGFWACLSIAECFTTAVLRCLEKWVELKTDAAKWIVPVVLFILNFAVAAKWYIDVTVPRK